MGKILKSMCFLLITTSVFSLAACDYEYYLYHDNIRINSEVIEIQLINYYNPADTENLTENTIFDAEKLVVLETLNIDNNESFLTELSEIGGLSSKLEQTIDSPNGKGILITYQDDGFTIITVSNINDKDCIFVGHFDANADIEGFYGISWPEMIDDFKAIILKYFDATID